MNRRTFISSALSLLALSLAACQAPAANTPATSGSTTPASGATATSQPTAAAGTTPTKAAGTTPTTAALADPNLKVGTLPIVDVVPMFLAEKNGYFKELGINVQLIPFSSAVERDTAAQAGQIDGMLNDLISTLLLNKSAEQVKIVRTGLKTNPDRFIFSIIVPGNSPIKTIEELKGKDVALSLNTVIEYWTDELLASKGFKESDYKKTPIPSIPARLQALSSGQVASANMPEPFASKAIKDGARLILDDRGSNFGTTSTIVFTGSSVKSKPETVRRFLQAFDRAAKEINTNPEQYRALLVEEAKVAPDIKDTFQMVPYPDPQVPTKDEIERVMKWAVAHKPPLLTEAIPYEKMVDPSLITKS